MNKTITIKVKKSLNKRNIPNEKGIKKLSYIDGKVMIYLYLINYYKWLNKTDDIFLNDKKIRYPKHVSKKKYKKYDSMYRNYRKKHKKRVESWKELCPLCEINYSEYQIYCDECLNRLLEEIKNKFDL